MKVTDFLKNNNLDNSLLIGFYGGGNFGDELLLETLVTLFVQYQIKGISILHFSDNIFGNWHKIPSFYLIINYKNIIKIFGRALKSNSIVVGGGGLWGLDANLNILFMSSMLFFCRFLLRKKVYLLGVGYYNSTNFWGKVSAWLAGHSANLIISRDNESYDNFKKINKNTFIDFDLAFNLKSLNLDNYENDVKLLTRNIKLLEKNVFFTSRGVKFTEHILQIVTNNPRVNFILLDFHKFKRNNKIVNEYNNVRKKCFGKSNLSIYEFNYNPVALFCFFKKNADKIFMISPQYHGQIISYLTGVKFMPISYDNKNIELFKRIGIKNFYNMQSIDIGDLQGEINSYINR